MATGLLRKFGDTAYKLDNIRRGLLVSQIATSMRNFTAQIGRVGVHTLTGAMDNALNATFNPLRRLFGNEAVDHTNSFGLLLNLTTDKKFAKDATEFATKYFVNEKDRLFNRYASDVADASQTQTMKGAQKVVDGLNFLNRMQEFYYRRGMFASSLEETLRKKGISLKEAVESNDISRITKADVEKAVDDALEFTYAKTPDNQLGKSFVNLSNSIPFITTGVVPFARFMTNAMKFQFQHSPLGPLALLSRKERAAVAKGDMGVFSKAMIGSALLMAAVEAKRRGFGGEKWYELKGTDGTTIDARPYFPMTPYLLVADLIVRTEDGRIPPDAKDILQGLTGAQFRTGTGLALIDSIINDVAGIDSEEKISKTITRFISDVLGSYLTPFRMFGDFTNQQQTFRTALPETQKFEDIPINVLEQFKRSIPGVRETLPELESPTRAAAPGRPEKVRLPFTDIQVPGPLARQLTGITVSEEKNPAEKELDRLGFKRRDILPYTGDQIADQLNAKYLGPVLEKVVSAVVQPRKRNCDERNFKRIKINHKRLCCSRKPTKICKDILRQTTKSYQKAFERRNTKHKTTTRKMNQQQIGRAGEHLTASYLCRYFDDVFTASEASRFDFLAVKDGCNYKIQVKTTNSPFVKNNNDWLRWDIRKKISNKDNEYRVYDEDEVDIFAFVCLFIDKVVFVPNKNVGKTYQKKVEFISEIQTLETLVSSAQVVRDLKL
jgi:hypothetical protein